MRQKREDFKRLIAARDERKKAKASIRKMLKSTRRRDIIIFQQELASQHAAKIKETLSFKREAFDALQSHLEMVHEKQRKQLYAAQERKADYEKNIHELQTKHMKEEVRSAEFKKFQVRQTHQVAVDKRSVDQLREIQQLELKHAKVKL